ncbi:MAG: nitroreductase family protein [Alphaproteobacteria bacterium]|nr:nitroreductase family protein [Alphaproteobacteria bacterium]
MSKLFYVLLIICFACPKAFANDTLDLPEPDKSDAVSLMQALNNRQSIKTFAIKNIDNTTLSTILWAAYGVNRPDDHRVIPTAMNEKDLDIYVFNKDGIWKYNVSENSLLNISTDDKRVLFQTQDYMKNAPVVLVYVGSSKDYAAMHAGSAYQNVGLFCAANNMANVVRGFFNKDDVAKALYLPKDQRVIISQAIGFKAE